MSATVLTGSKIAELVGKFPNLGIDTFVPERDYNQAVNSARELERYRTALYRANGYLIQLGRDPVKLEYAPVIGGTVDG